MELEAAGLLADIACACYVVYAVILVWLINGTST